MLVVNAATAQLQDVYQGWSSQAGLRAHFDAHLLGAIPGRPLPEWMRQCKLTTCAVCGKPLSTTLALGMHQRCWALRVSRLIDPQERPIQTDDVVQSGPPDAGLYTSLPCLSEIALAPVPTIEFLSVGAFPHVEREYKRCLANVVLYSRPDAWEPGGDAAEVPSKMQARVA